MLPYPMPGKLSYFFTPPACYYAWGSLVILGISAVGGLLLQNAALMHFSASEVRRRRPRALLSRARRRRMARPRSLSTSRPSASQVVPVYFSMFVIGGVGGSGLAFGELTMPWVLMLMPGIALCIGGVFAIAYRRDERVSARTGTATAFVPLSARNSMLRNSGLASARASLLDTPLGADAYAHGYAHQQSGLVTPDRPSRARRDSSRSTCASDCGSVASEAAYEEQALFAAYVLGGGSMASMANYVRRRGVSNPEPPAAPPNSAAALGPRVVNAHGGPPLEPMANPAADPFTVDTPSR